MRIGRKILQCLLVVAIGSHSSHSMAEIYEGVEFPSGVSSFADLVTQYDPAFGGGPVPARHSQDARQILGVPRAGGLSLGNGGRVTVQFVDNRLTGSGDSSPDLWIFEVGYPETVHVEISKNRGTWFAVGSATGPAFGIDIDQYGFDGRDRFRFVRLTDDGDSPGGSPFVQGADVVGIGASSSTSVHSKHHRIKYWIQAHVGGRSELIIRANTMQWHHLEGTAPGLGDGFWSFDKDSNSPTIIDSNQGPNIGWIPSGWPDVLGNGAHPESYSTIFGSLTPVLPAKNINWRLKKLSGVGKVRIVQQPRDSNGYTLIIEFDDLGAGAEPGLAGTGFYRIQLLPRNWPG